MRSNLDYISYQNNIPTGLIEFENTKKNTNAIVP